MKMEDYIAEHAVLVEVDRYRPYGSKEVWHSLYFKHRTMPLEWSVYRTITNRITGCIKRLDKKDEMEMTLSTAAIKALLKLVWPNYTLKGNETID